MSSRFGFEQAITKAILETIGTDFLLKDGSRAMTGNLDMGNNVIENISAIEVDGIYLDKTNKDVLLYRKAANMLGIYDDVTLDTGRLTLSTHVLIKCDATKVEFRNAGDTDGVSVKVKQMQIQDKFWFTEAAEFLGAISGVSGLDVFLKTYQDGFPPTTVTIATMEGGVPCFSIQRAGDITFLDGKKLKWSDIELSRSAAGMLHIHTTAETQRCMMRMIPTEGADPWISGILAYRTDYTLDQTNYEAFYMLIYEDEFRIWADKGGTGSLRPIKFLMGADCVLSLETDLTLDFQTRIINNLGGVVLNAGASLDALTNAGYVKIRRVSQADQPTPDTGEILIWYDTDDTLTYLVYEDSVGGTRAVELAFHQQHSGLTDTKVFTDGDKKTHTVVVEDGLIQSWAIA